MTPADNAFDVFHQFIPRAQRSLLAQLAADSEEKEHFRQKIAEIVKTVRAMPKTYEGDGIARLHYFSAGCDWWITERDSAPDGHQAQAFGLADLGHGEAELGYISIEELTASPRVEIDLYWTPRPVDEIQAERNRR